MTDTAAAPETGRLRSGALGLVDTTVIAVSSTAPAYSVATALAGLAVVVSLQMPAALLLGFIPVTGIAVAFYYLNRNDPNCGASYTWVGKALSPSLGFLNGWVILVSDVIFCAFAGPQAGQALLQLINNANIYSVLGINLNAGDLTAATVAGILTLVLVTYMVVTGIKVAARFQWLLLALEYIAVVVISIAGLVRKGGSSFGWDWFDPRGLGSLSTLASGVVISVFLYWGWDTAANCNEESSDASENPGKAGILGMFALLGIFLLATVSVQMTLTPDELSGSGTSTLNVWATKLFPQPWASLGVLALLSSTIATVQTTLLPGVRTAFSMGRDRVLGRLWTHVNARYLTPVVGTLVMSGLILAIMVIDLKLDRLNAIISAGVLAIGILVSFYYGWAGIACAVYYRRRLLSSPMTFIAVGAYPFLSSLTLFGLAGYLIQQSWSNSGDLVFDATNGKFQVLIPVLVIASGVPALIWSRLRYRSPFYRAGRQTAPRTDLAAAGVVGGG